MKTSPRWFHVLWLFVGLLAFIAACKDPAPDPPKPTVPTITSVDPASAPVGSTIAINGTNFSTTPGSNTVLIGGVVATVDPSSTANRLIVTVPAGAQSGTITVTVGSTTVQSPTSFTVAPKPLKPVVELQGTLFRNRNLSKDTIYLLRGLVYVGANYTMTIPAGTVIKGASADLDPAAQNNAGTLIVERLGKLIANGTATDPIVFTSNKAAGQRFPGDWGGIVLIGKAPTNRPGATLYSAYFGTLRGTAETYNEPEDNSGSLQYVRIEYAGTSQRGTTTGRIAGLTMIGVGTGTTINHVQVTQSSGDAFGWYGGGVPAKYLVANRTTDDDWSTDWGYTGQVQFGVALRDPAVSDPSGSNGFESQNYNPGENADGSALTRLNGLPQTAPVFANISNFGTSTTPVATTAITGFYRAGAYIYNNTGISIYNSLIYGYPEGVRLEGTLTGVGASLTSTSGIIDLRGNVIANTLLPVVGGRAVTDAAANTYLTTATRQNQIVGSGDIAALMLNAANFSATAPNFLPQTGSTLLGGAVTGGKLAGTFFTQTTYRGAFGTDNWITGWTNFNTQNTDYDR